MSPSDELTSESMNFWLEHFTRPLRTGLHDTRCVFAWQRENQPPSEFDLWMPAGKATQFPKMVALWNEKCGPLGIQYTLVAVDEA